MKEQEPVKETKAEREKQDVPWEEPDEDFWDEEEDEDEGEPPKRQLWIRKTIVWLIVVLMLGNVLAFWPQIYNLDAIRFLAVSRSLSQNEDIKLYKQSVATVSADSSKGTGFSIAGGYIVTNHHVIADASRVMVSFDDDNSVREAQVIGSNPSIDIAILKTEDAIAPKPALELARQSELRGDIYVIGNPLFFSRIANQGEIVGLTLPAGWAEPVIAIDAPIYKGNSGSPLLDASGKVIGVIFATQRITLNGERTTVGLAVPIEQVLRYLEELEIPL